MIDSFVMVQLLVIVYWPLCGCVVACARGKFNLPAVLRPCVGGCTYSGPLLIAGVQACQ